MPAFSASLSTGLLGWQSKQELRCAVVCAQLLCCGTTLMMADPISELLFIEDFFDQFCHLLVPDEPVEQK